MTATGPIKGISTTASKVRERIAMPRIMPLLIKKPFSLSNSEPASSNVLEKKQPHKTLSRLSPYSDKAQHHFEKICSGITGLGSGMRITEGEKAATVSSSQKKRDSRGAVDMAGAVTVQHPFILRIPQRAAGQSSAPS